MKNKFIISTLSVCAFMAASISLYAQNTVPVKNCENEINNSNSSCISYREGVVPSTIVNNVENTSIKDGSVAPAMNTVSEQKQDVSYYNKGLYLGISGSLASGVCTYTSDKPGFQGNIFVGYRFSKLFSLEAGFGYGKLDISARKCCSNHPGINNERNSYWRSFSNDNWYQLPDNHIDGSWYCDLTGETQYYKGVLQVNFNVLSFFYDKEDFEDWNLEISPRIGFMKTKTTLTGPGTLSGLTKSVDKDLNHFIWGGQASVAYNLKCGIGLGIYGAVDMLTGDHFDNIPEHVHTSNYIWDLGLKLTYTFWK